MKLISLEGQQSEKVVSRCLTSSTSSWICTRFQVLRKTLNWLTRDKLLWNRFLHHFFPTVKRLMSFAMQKRFSSETRFLLLSLSGDMSRDHNFANKIELLKLHPDVLNFQWFDMTPPINTPIGRGVSTNHKSAKRIELCGLSQNVDSDSDSDISLRFRFGHWWQVICLCPALNTRMKTITDIDCITRLDTCDK